MTTFEHAMLGVNGVLATGLHRRFGWQIAAMAGVAAVGPDWDGLPILFSVTLFDAAHRVWGHNVFACVALGVIVGAIDYRFDLVTRVARFATSRLHLHVSQTRLEVRREFHWSACCTWLVVAVLAALSQLPADMIVSGTATLSHWALQPFWPLSSQRWVFPLLSWGDPGVSLVFAAGMFAMVRWKSSVQGIACLTLIVVATYAVFRGFVV